jgi:hypothetical protein
MPFLAHPDLIFSLGNGLALLSWLALAISPYRARWAPRVRFVTGRVVPLIFGVVYVALFATTGMGDGGFDSPAAVQRLFAVPELLTAGWLHYLAFDLFVGTWIAERGGALGIPHVALMPMLALTFMFGPAGLLAFAVLRLIWLRRPPASKFTHAPSAIPLERRSS